MHKAILYFFIYLYKLTQECQEEIKLSWDYRKLSLWTNQLPFFLLEFPASPSGPVLPKNFFFSI